MIKYYVRLKPQLDGVNAVHKENCPFLDDIKMKRYLGEFSSCMDAIREAKKYFSHSKGCSFCTKERLTPKAYSHQIWNKFSMS
jgi:hypothetical protein